MHTFKLKILTPDSKLFEGEVISFTVPTQAGEITVLKNHAPLITIISIGEIKIKTTAGDKKFLVQGGVIDVKETENFEVIILADQNIENTSTENLDEEVKRAKQAMAGSIDLDLETFESQIERGEYFKKLKAK